MARLFYNPGFPKYYAKKRVRIVYAGKHWSKDDGHACRRYQRRRTLHSLNCLILDLMIKIDKNKMNVQLKNTENGSGCLR